MNSLFQKILDVTREVTPLSFRIKIGPIVAYIAYVIRIYILKNTKAPEVLSLDKTLDLIIRDNLSVIRFGDGEMSFIENINLGFQKRDVNLSSLLKKVLQLNMPGLLICVPGMFDKIDQFSNQSFRFTLHHLFRHFNQWTDLLSPDQIYGDAFITRPYLTYNKEGRSKSGDIFKKLFSIWDNMEVVLIEGSKSRLGVGNDMFQNTKSLGRILCPAENAYSKYQEIKEEAIKISKNKLILLSLGPTAKILAYELFQLGYRVVDIGHVDMEYEMFRRNADKLVEVPYKYFNEINARSPEECIDETYIRQIIAKIV